MSDHVASPHHEERASLLPVVATIIGCYFVILSVGYLVGNLIYQIP